MLYKTLPLPIEGFNNDCELLALIKQGDKDAFGTLYRLYWKDLYDRVYQRLKNGQQAEDIVQDVFVSLWTRRSTLVIENLPAYLHTAVKFRVFSYVERELASDSFFEPLETIADYQSATDSRLLDNEMLRLVQLFANTLPEKRKQIFLMHFSGSLNTREIAEQLHIKQKTVQNQLGRAIEILKTRIADLGIIFICYFLF